MRRSPKATMPGCKLCRGEGTVQTLVSTHMMLGKTYKRIPCPACEGTGLKQRPHEFRTLLLIGDRSLVLEYVRARTGLSALRMLPEYPLYGIRYVHAKMPGELLGHPHTTTWKALGVVPDAIAHALEFVTYEEEKAVQE